MTNEPTEQLPGRAGRREWLGLGVIALACPLYSMDLTVLHLAVPALAADLEPSSTQLLWIIDIYGFVLAGCLITTGSLGDRIGRRRLLLIGAAGFGCASVAAAFSTSPEMLIATRAVLGVAGATLAPSTLSLIRTMFSDSEQRTTAVGIWITSFSIGAVVGPARRRCPAGTLLVGIGVSHQPPGDGRSTSARAADPSGVPRRRRRTCRPGERRVVAGGDSRARVRDQTHCPRRVFGCVGGHRRGRLPVGWAFVRRNRRLRDPLIDPTLLRIPAFDAAIVTYGVGVLILVGGFLFLAQYRQLSLGMSPLVAGLAMVPASLAFILVTNVTPPLARRVAPTTLIGGGLVVAAGGYVTLLTLEPGTGGWQTVIGPIVFSSGWHRCSRSRTTRSSLSPRPSGPARPRGSPKPPPMSGAPSGSPCSAAWPWPCTAPGSMRPCRRTRPHTTPTPRATRSRVRSTLQIGCRTTGRPASSLPHSPRSPLDCTSRRRSAPWPRLCSQPSC